MTLIRLDTPESDAASATADVSLATAVTGGNGDAPPQVKTFVVDTNVLLHNPNALLAFDEHDVVIPIEVIEELDTFKTGNDDVARNARATIRHLDALREEGELSKGVRTPSGGSVRITLDEGLQECPASLRSDKPDNRIICTAYNLTRQGKRCIFVSKDINARIKADALGVVAEDFENQKVDFESLFTGYREVAVEGDVIDALFRDKEVSPDRLNGSLKDRKLLANEYVIFKDKTNDGHSAVGKYRSDIDRIVPLKPRRAPAFGVVPRNVQQTMAMDLLLDDSVKLVSLVGGAGTGKTLLALAAGMSKVLNDEVYSKLLAARPIMPMGRDIGYLPGDKDEKLGAWMQPIFDNVAYLLSNKLTEGKEQQAEKHGGRDNVEQRLNALIDNGTLVMEPLTYIRGRSIPHQFIIVDEAQNLTPHEVKTIASRVGEGTKLVFTGDATQIDNPYLDASSNGLSYLVERLKGKPLVGHVTLAKSERSELARLVTAEL